MGRLENHKAAHRDRQCLECTDSPCRRRVIWEDLVWPQGAVLKDLQSRVGTSIPIAVLGGISGIESEDSLAAVDAWGS